MQRSGAAMAWNVFKFCTALRGLGSIMILLVLAIVGVSYYTIVIAIYGPALFHTGLPDSLAALAVLLLFHFLLGMLLWSYFSVVLTNPGSVPPNWRPVMDEEKGDMDPLMSSEYEGPGLGSSRSTMDPANPRIRFCRKCNQVKPPRCHHCSVCARCVLKMDHHCVWVVNCVGALNYKYFFLFLCGGYTIHTVDMARLDLQDSNLQIKLCHFNGVFYTFLETILVTLSLLPYFVKFFTDGEIPGTPSTLAATLITFILNLSFALSVLGFLIMHISLIAANTTTIEAYEKKTTREWRYDLGWKENFQQVLGRDKKYWLIPAYSDEDLRLMPALQGLEYPTRPDLDVLRGF